MVFSKSISWSELLFIALFGIAYLIYILKTITSANKLQLGYRHLLVKLIIRSLFVGLLVVSLLGPSFGDIKKEVKSVGKDVYFLLDLSKSMLANDLAPNRVSRAKQEIRKIAGSLTGDRIGLIVFTSAAFMQCPVTLDKSAFFTFLEACDVEKMPSGGTEFFMPLDMVFQKFETDREGGQKSKIVVLVSDGEDFNTNTFGLVKEMADKSIRIFTLGVGTVEGSKIPTKFGYKKDREGNEVITKLNSSFLRKIALETNAEYFEINREVNQTNKLIDELKKLEGEVIATKTVDYKANKFSYFLIVALLLLCIDILLTINIIRL